MICALGLCLRSQVGKAMEAQWDLSERGGTLMMRRVVWPRRQASSSEAMSSMCQLGRNGVVGLSSMKLRSMKVEKSWRRKVLYSSGVSGDCCFWIIFFSCPFEGKCNCSYGAPLQKPGAARWPTAVRKSYLLRSFRHGFATLTLG